MTQTAALFTDSPFETVQADQHHRGHAQAEQVFPDWIDGPLAHLPSGSFPASAARLALAAMSCNLLHNGGCLARITKPLDWFRRAEPGRQTDGVASGAVIDVPRER